MIKARLRRWAEGADRFMHRRGWSPEWLCELADLSYGVPVDGFGPPEHPRMASRPALLLWRLIGDAETP